MFGIKRTKADKYFSDFIRERDNWTCQRCLKEYEKPSQGLHCSHFHSRAKKSVRFDPDNAIALCMSCHLYVGGNPYDHAEIFLKRLGKEKYEALAVRANTPCKIDEATITLGFKMELKRMKNERKVLKTYK